MSDLEAFEAFAQVDSQQRLARAAHHADRANAAAAAIAACLRATGLQPVSPGQPVTLALPPELQPLGALAVQLCEPHPFHLSSSPLHVGHPPQAELRVGNIPVDLTAYLTAATHPAETLQVMVGLWAALHRLPTPETAPAAVHAALERCRVDVPAEENPAKQMALRLHERIPCFWGTGIEAAAARDWAVRLLWHAESMAVATHQDELSRLMVMARFPRFWPNAAVFVRLASPDATGDLAQQLSAILQRRRFTTWEVAAPEPLSPLGRALYWLELGEWIALYAAALHNVDPAAHVPLTILFDEP